MFRIRIFQPSVPEYRVGLYEGLAKRYKGRIDLWASPEGRAKVKSMPVKGMPFDYSHILVRFRNFYWQKGMSLKGLSRGDVLVVCGEIKGISNVVFAAIARCRGIRVVWWGHHWSITSNWVSVFIRLQVVKLVADAYLCYTQTGVDFLRRHGFANRQVFATGNTIDAKPIKVACSRWDEASLACFRRENGLADRDVLLICGVLRDKVRLDLLLKAISDSKIIAKNIALVVIGDGPANEKYREYSRTLGLGERVKWLGATRDQEVMAPWFLSSKAFVYPGAIGLGIIHSMFYGLPVIVNDNPSSNGPEYEIMENGRTGLVFKEGNPDDLVEKILLLLEHEDQRREMGRYAKEKAEKKYSMDNMVDNFSLAIETVSAQ